MKINCKVCNQPIREDKFFKGRIIKCEHCGYIFDLSKNIVLSLYSIIITVIFLIIMKFVVLYLEQWINVNFFVFIIIASVIISPIDMLVIAPVYQKIFKYFYNKKEWP